MTIGSLFSGIGGLELGLEWAGLGPTVFQVEQDPYCRAVLARHWPHARRYDDVRTVGAHNLDPVRLICGGFPCQDVSAAGKGAGLDGARSGLWFEFLRIVEELKPPAVVVENVGSGATRWVDACVSGLERAGYQVLPTPLAARDVGAPHLRRRVFLVAYSQRFDLRFQRERLSGGRASGVRAQGLAEPGLYGEAGTVADTGLQRLTEGRLPLGTGEAVAVPGQRGPHVPNAPGSRPQGQAGAQPPGRALAARCDPEQPRHDPHADGRGCEQQRVAQQGGLEGQPGAQLDGCGAAEGQQRGGQRPHPWLVEPDVGRVVDGVSDLLDAAGRVSRGPTPKGKKAGRRQRLQALGNSVVPQCAQVVGEVLRLLVEREGEQ